jgi:hypothetical protein
MGLSLQGQRAEYGPPNSKGGTSRFSLPEALFLDKQLLMGRRRKSGAPTGLGSHGGSRKGRGQSRFLFPHSLSDVSY